MTDIAPAGRKGSILVVEDNLPDADFLSTLVKRIRPDTELTIVADGESAVKLLLDPKTPVPDLVLLDINLPRLSGHDVLQRVRSGQRCRYVPVVVLSTSRTRSDIESALQLGANAYVVKPFGVDEAIKVLTSTVEFWLDTAQRTDTAPKPAGTV